MDNTDYKWLGDNLRKIRKSHGWAQEKFAFAADIDRSYYSKIERGEVNVSIKFLVKIAKTLKVSVKELIPDSYP